MLFTLLLCAVSFLLHVLMCYAVSLIFYMRINGPLWRWFAVGKERRPQSGWGGELIVLSGITMNVFMMLAFMENPWCVQFNVLMIILTLMPKREPRHLQVAGFEEIRRIY